MLGEDVVTGAGVTTATDSGIVSGVSERDDEFDATTATTATSPTAATKTTTTTPLRAKGPRALASSFAARVFADDVTPRERTRSLAAPLRCEESFEPRGTIRPAEGVAFAAGTRPADGVVFVAGAGVAGSTGASSMGSGGAGVAASTGTGVAGSTGAGVAGSTGAGVAGSTGGSVAPDGGAGVGGRTGASVAQDGGAGVGGRTGARVAGSGGAAGCDAAAAFASICPSCWSRSGVTRRARSAISPKLW
jgi:hypothetical protein